MNRINVGDVFVAKHAFRCNEVLVNKGDIAIAISDVYYNKQNSWYLLDFMICGKFVVFRNNGDMFLHVDNYLQRVHE